ncbi:hypothetical protein Tco_0771247 [Tanacetum coccineum]|uniref:Gag-pol polyprotein n=1 Tax=Tanacetum coccineum TaxID=301880 RepID=A0ABQ4ZFT2_9ASTR
MAIEGVERLKSLSFDEAHWKLKGPECGDPNHLIGECSKPPKDKNQRALLEALEYILVMAGEEEIEKVKDEYVL